jgi:Flp pilus assembly pilin Flp
MASREPSVSGRVDLRRRGGDKRHPLSIGACSETGGMIMGKPIARDNRGQDLIEYALLAALLAVACMAALSMLSDPLAGLFSTILDMLRSLL